jgi:hypothetical protein
LRGGRRAAIAVALMATTLGSAGLSAHRLDECLQAARIAIEPERLQLELDLTPGMAAADAMIAGIDSDGDGVLSAGEQRAYVDAVLAEIAIDIDGRSLPVAAGSGATFAGIAALRRGEGTIAIRSTIPLPEIGDGGHRLFFRNSHARDISVYLANALVPQSDRVAVTAQRHDTGQRELTIDYVLRPDRGVPASTWLVPGIGLALLAALSVWPAKSGGVSAALRQS